MKGKCLVDFLGEGDFKPFDKSGIEQGPLKMPGSLIGRLIAFGEDEQYLHCVFAETGGYYGVFKSPDKDHLYQKLIELNVERIEK